MIRRAWTVLFVAGLVLPTVLCSVGCSEEKTVIPSNKNMDTPKSIGGAGPGAGGNKAAGGGNPNQKAE